MDRVWTVPEIAHELGVSTDRVRRHIDRLGITSIRASESSARPITLVDARGRTRLRDAIGPAPALAARLDLSETDVRVAIAITHAPRGLTSARAVARRANVSPTSALRSIEQLRELGIVVSSTERIAFGTAKDVQILHLNRASQRAQHVARTIASTAPTRRDRPARHKVPNELRHVFWNVADAQLSLPDSAPFVARRLITSNDLDGLSWGTEHLDAAAWRHAAATRGLPPRRRRLAENVAADLETDGA